MAKKTDGALADIPGPLHAHGYVPAHAAADATLDHVIFRAPFACKVRKVSIMFGATLTGADTNSANLNLINRGADGLGTTELANRDYASGTNDTAYVKRDHYAPASPLAVAQGVVLTMQREKIGTGLATPDIHVQVEYEAN